MPAVPAAGVPSLTFSSGDFGSGARCGPDPVALGSARAEYVRCGWERLGSWEVLAEEAWFSSDDSTARFLWATWATWATFVEREFAA